MGIRECDESALWEEIAARHRPGETISDTFAAVHVLRPYMLGRKQEHLYAILVDNRYVPIGAPRLVAVGTINSVESKPRDIFRDAITENALGIFLAHNHPSDQPEPSQADIDFTAMVSIIGQILGVPVFDSMVITDHGFTSIAGLIADGSREPSKNCELAIQAITSGKIAKELGK